MKKSRANVLTKMLASILAFIMAVSVWGGGLMAEEAESIILGDYIQIASAQEIALIGNHPNFPLNGRYVLVNDIDLREITPGAANNAAWHNTRGWRGIGGVAQITDTANFLSNTNTQNAFRGIFDGNGHTIRGLQMNRNSTVAQLGQTNGLFRILNGAEIRNLNIELGGDIEGYRQIGALAGVAVNNTVIYNVNVIGNGYRVRGNHSGRWAYVAGLVGRVENSTIISSGAENLRVYGAGFTGGLIGGADRSLIEDSHVHSMTITTINNLLFNYTGGFIGGAGRTLHNTVVPGEDRREGGTEINNSSATNVSVHSGSSHAGGFIGALYHRSIIRYSFVDGGSVAPMGSNAGSWMGGFAGVVGYGAIVHHSWTNASVEGTEYIGGFAGVIYGIPGIRGLEPFSQLCGVVAYGDVRGRNDVGGLVGVIYDNSIVTTSAAYGNVYSQRAGAGGFAARLDRGHIQNAYSHGDVHVVNANLGHAVFRGVGGFIGHVRTPWDWGDRVLAGRSIIENVYSIGNVTVGNNTVPAHVGAFIGGGDGGANFRTMNLNGANFFDNVTSTNFTDQPTGNASQRGDGWLRGEGTAVMQTQSTFDSYWNFHEIWIMSSIHHYPTFRSNAPCGLQPPGPGIPPVNVYHDVIFHMNDGSEMYNIVTVRHGQTVQRPENPVRPAFAFAGWFRYADNRDHPFSFHTPITKDTNLFAAWNWRIPEVEVDITEPDPDGDLEVDVYFPQGGAGSGNATEEDDGSNTIVVTPDEGYEFDDDTDITVNVPDGWEEDEDERHIDDDGNLIIVVRPIYYYVTFFVNDGTYDVHELQLVRHGRLAVRPAINPIKPGFAFGGWFRDYNSRINPFDFATAILEHTRVYAAWNFVIPDLGINVTEPGGDGYVDIELEFPGGGDGSYIADRDGDYTTIVVVPDEGYAFDEDTNVYVNIPEDWEIVDGPELGDSGNIYVVIRPVYYNLTFWMNDGSDYIVHQTTVRHGRTLGTVILPPARIGYVFVGWAFEPGGNLMFNFFAPVLHHSNVFATWFPIGFFFMEGMSHDEILDFLRELGIEVDDFSAR